MTTTNTAQTAGREPAPERTPRVTQFQREEALRLVRRERRRLQQRAHGRFEYLKRVYD